MNKHNPYIDWRVCSVEFNRNGRRYILWPAKPTPKNRIASPEEFASFVDDTTSLYLIGQQQSPNAQVPPPGNGDESFTLQVSEEEKGAVTETESETENEEDSDKPPTLPRKLLRWINRKCPDLLREIGRPPNLEPFEIDTGDAKPINIRPRSYSSLDLEKINEFIDENLKNGVISESKSPWSFPLVLAQKPNGGT